MFYVTFFFSLVVLINLNFSAVRLFFLFFFSFFSFFFSFFSFFFFLLTDLWLSTKTEKPVCLQKVCSSGCHTCKQNKTT